MTNSPRPCKRYRCEHFARTCEPYAVRSENVEQKDQKIKKYEDGSESVTAPLASVLIIFLIFPTFL